METSRRLLRYPEVLPMPLTEELSVSSPHTTLLLGCFSGSTHLEIRDLSDWMLCEVLSDVSGSFHFPGMWFLGIELYLKPYLRREGKPCWVPPDVAKTLK